MSGGVRVLLSRGSFKKGFRLPPVRVQPRVVQPVRVCVCVCVCVCACAPPVNVPLMGFDLAVIRRVHVQPAVFSRQVSTSPGSPDDIQLGRSILENEAALLRLLYRSPTTNMQTCQYSQRSNTYRNPFIPYRNLFYAAIKNQISVGARPQHCV